MGRMMGIHFKDRNSAEAPRRWLEEDNFRRIGGGGRMCLMARLIFSANHLIELHICKEGRAKRVKEKG